MVVGVGVGVCVCVEVSVTSHDQVMHASRKHSTKNCEVK